MLQMSESTLVLHVSYKCKDTTKLCKTENSSFLCILKKSLKNTHVKCFKIILTQTFIIKQFPMHQVQDCGGKRAF